MSLQRVLGLSAPSAGSLSSKCTENPGWVTTPPRRVGCGPERRTPSPPLLRSRPWKPSPLPVWGDGLQHRKDVKPSLVAAHGIHIPLYPCLDLGKVGALKTPHEYFFGKLYPHESFGLIRLVILYPCFMWPREPIADKSPGPERNRWEKANSDWTQAPASHMLIFLFLNDAATTADLEAS